jgi:copper chaperone CopZ
MHDLKIEDMTCGHCVSTVTQTVKSIDPNAKIEIDLASKRVRIDSTQSLETLREVLSEAGYPPQPFPVAIP